MMLYHETRNRVRVYSPDAAPSDVRDKACQREAEGIEAEQISESVFGTCNETGLKGELREHGIDLDTGRAGRGGPSWRILDKGEGASLSGSVVDVAKFLAYLEREGEIDRNDVRRLLYVERDAGIVLRFNGRRGYGEGTVADFDSYRVEWPSKAIADSLELLGDAWEDYVRALERRTVKALRDEWEYLASWATIAERLKDFGEGIDENGRAVPLSECIEQAEPEEDGEGEDN